MNKNWQNIFIGVVVALFVLLIGYIIAATSIAEDVFMKGNRNLIWDVGFVKAEKAEVVGTATEHGKIKFEKTFAYFNVGLVAPGDSITYDFTIKNLGKLNAVVTSIYVLPRNRNDDAILFTVDGVKTGDVLRPQQSKVLKVKAEYNPNYNGNQVGYRKGVKVIVNYAQK